MIEYRYKKEKRILMDIFGGDETIEPEPILNDKIEMTFTNTKGIFYINRYYKSKKQSQHWIVILITEGENMQLKREKILNKILNN